MDGFTAWVTHLCPNCGSELSLGGWRESDGFLYLLWNCKFNECNRSTTEIFKGEVNESGRSDTGKERSPNSRWNSKIVPRIGKLRKDNSD
jgi:hypothetical protein